MTVIQKQKKIDLIVVTAAVLPIGGGYPEISKAISTFRSPPEGKSPPSFSRDQEIQADQIGLLILYQAGYDSREAEKVVRKFIKLESLLGQNISLFSTHPNSQTRLSKIQSWISTVGETSFSDTIVTTREFAEFKSMH